MKKRWLFASFVLFSACTYAQQSVPVIRFDSVPDPIKLPKDMYLGEATGVAVNSKGHVFVLPPATRPDLRTRQPRLSFSSSTRTANSFARSARTSTPGLSRIPCGSISRTISGPPTKARTW